ncbi:MAG TPA: tetratricopeptide repeat protein [Candidatus Angelobacter sp.]
MRWSRGNNSGAIATPFEWQRVLLEEAPRGAVTVEGIRSEKRQVWRLRSDVWGIDTRPNFAGDLRSLYLRAGDLAQNTNPTDTLSHWREVAAHGRSTELPWIEPWLLCHAAQILSDAKQLDQSDIAYQEAVQKAANAGPSVRGALFKDWAYHLVYRGELAGAERHYEEAKVEWEKFDKDSLTIATILLSTGRVALRKGDLDKAQRCYQESLDIIRRRAPESIQMLGALTGLASVAGDRGDLVGRERYTNQALRIGSQLFPNSQSQASMLTSLGYIAYERGDLRKAETYFKHALRISESINPQSREASDVLGRLGDCRMDEGDLREAERYNRRALAIIEKLKPGSMEVAYSYASLGHIAELRGSLVEAEAYDRQALSIADKLIPVPEHDVARLLMRLASLLGRSGDLSAAETDYRQALAMIERLVPTSLTHIEALAGLASNLRRQGKVELASRYYREALTGIEGNMQLGGIEEDGSRYRAKYSAVYREYSDLLVKQGQTELAFEFAESSRARSLLEMLSRARVDFRRGLDPLLAEQERKLKQRLTVKSNYRLRLIASEHSNQQVSTLDSEIEQILTQYREVEDEIRAASPSYAALSQPRALATKEIQRLLDRDTVLLEYSLGEDGSYLWIVCGDSLQVRELPKRTEIEKVARHFYESLTARTHKVSTDPQHEALNWAKADTVSQSLATRLSEMILVPAANLIEGKRLLIVSDGALQYVPFSALPAPEDPRLPLWPTMRSSICLLLQFWQS